MIKNRKWPVIVLTVIIIVFILELLPYGAVLRFGNPEGEPWIRTYSYFDMTPFGYADFGPLITAILTCVLMAISIVGLFADNGRIRSAVKIVSFIAFLSSLAPLIVNCYSVVGGVISVLLSAVFVITTMAGRSHMI